MLGVEVAADDVLDFVAELELDDELPQPATTAATTNVGTMARNKPLIKASPLLCRDIRSPLRFSSECTAIAAIVRELLTRGGVCPLTLTKRKHSAMDPLLVHRADGGRRAERPDSPAAT
jgi:hypothetical protein